MADKALIAHRNCSVIRIREEALFRMLSEDRNLGKHIVASFEPEWIVVPVDKEDVLREALDRIGVRPKLEGRWR